jgi:hypothetical protein
VLVNDCLFILLTLSFESIDHFVAKLHLLQIEWWSWAFISLTLISIWFHSLRLHLIVLKFIVFVIWGSADLWVRSAFNVAYFCRTRYLLQDEWVCFTARSIQWLRLEMLTFGHEFSFTTRLIPSGTPTWNLEGERLLGSCLIILVTPNRLHLSRRHYTVHQLRKLIHIVFARNISTNNLCKPFTLNPHYSQHLKMRTFLYVYKSLQVAKQFIDIVNLHYETVVQIWIFLTTHS